jgi:hypothetical protein
MANWGAKRELETRFQLSAFYAEVTPLVALPRWLMANLTERQAPSSAHRSPREHATTVFSRSVCSMPKATWKK